MADTLTAKEVQEVSKATSLAENGNAGLLRDLLHNQKDIAQHNKIINAMLNLNQEHLHAVELQEQAGLHPVHTSKLKLDELPKTVNGETIITRSLSSNGRSIYREVYNSSKKEYEDPGSVTRPSGIIPEFIPHKE